MKVGVREGREKEGSKVKGKQEMVHFPVQFDNSISCYLHPSKHLQSCMNGLIYKKGERMKFVIIIGLRHGFEHIVAQTSSL